jgi:ABC-type iron transport system FetAB ATPase subunit
LPEPRLRLAGLRGAIAGPFDLSLGPGECMSISGPSGSGKSLLLRMIADLDPNEGDVFLDGTPRAAFSAPAWRQKIVYLAAESGWWHDRVADHFPDVPAARAIATRLALKPELIDGAVARLSTGERQRLALVRALLLDSPVLLLDEPTGPLDEDSTALVENMLRERMAAGTSILLVTHSHAQADRMAGDRMVMRDFRLMAA